MLSASFHATWNLLLKRSDNQEAFVLGIVVSGSVMFVPLGIILFWLYPIDPPGYLFALVSTGFQSFYFVMLSRAYSRSDLSLIYPVARGIGPMLVPVLAVPLLGETVAWPAVVGIALIVGGIYVVSWWGRFRQIIAKPSTGCCETGASASQCSRGWRLPVTRWWTSAAWSTFNLSSICTCKLLGALWPWLRT